MERQFIFLEMEEMKREKIYMLWETLQQGFNTRQWSKIKQLPAHVFLRVQQTIVEQLLRDQKLYNKYFKHFYQNHVRLLNWWMLAADKKSEIQPYVFKGLVNKGMMFYNEKIKEVFEDKFQRVLPAKNPHSPRETQLLQEEVYRDFFNDLLNRNRLDNPRRPLNLKLYGSRPPDTGHQMDGHDFYIQTFNACNGWKYIFYNYQKHMQGLSEKGKYNDEIRPRDAKSPFEKKQYSNLKLTDFEHEESRPEKCRVEKVSKLLADKTAHSAQQLRRLARKDHLKKMVFVNHQGKPSTYLISRKNPSRKLL